MVNKPSINPMFFFHFQGEFGYPIAKEPTHFAKSQLGKGFNVPIGPKERILKKKQCF